MNYFFRFVSFLILILISTTNVCSQKYQFTNDSLPQEGVPKGTVEEYTLEESNIYPGSTHHYWTYVPAQYDETKPACVMVFLDGADFVHTKGEMRVPTVFDNLIHKGEMPVTIGIFVNPGRRGPDKSMRDEEYLPINDTFARFLLEDLIAEVGKDYNLVDDAAGRAVCGMSDGGVGTFTVVWHRPDAFSKAITHIASYVRIPGGAEYPFLVRQTRENPKPIRVFIQASENDLNIYEGNWTLGNIQMESALMFACYDYRFKMGTRGHDLTFGGAIFPDAVRWLWRDYPGVKGIGETPDLDALTGQWDVETNVLGHVNKSILTITERGGTLFATLVDENAGELEVTAISYKDGILIYEYKPPKSESKEKESKEEESKEKEGGWESNLATWLQVDGDKFKGAMCPAEKSEIDLSVKGRKRDGTP
jgi:enterochelin esterase family protein